MLQRFFQKHKTVNLNQSIRSNAPNKVEETSDRSYSEIGLQFKAYFTQTGRNSVRDVIRMFDADGSGYIDKTVYNNNNNKIRNS